ncbi:MAG: magnesium and cobalt transport protein CorA [Oxalobacter sp.]|nr:MAG: magnesium and cobalt transport protein CorA [Oxalobacter sp.]
MTVVPSPVEAIPSQHSQQTSPVVYCAAYLHGKKLADIPIEAISDYLENRQDVFIWVGLDEESLHLLKQMQEEFGLHPLAIEDAQVAHQRPKLEDYGETLFIVLRTVYLLDGRLSFGETHLFLGERFLLSVRHGYSHSYQRVHDRCEAMPDQMAEGPGFAMYALMDFVVDNYRPIVDALEERFGALEDALFNARFSREGLQNLYELKRELLLLRNAVVPLIDVCNALVRFHTNIIPRETRVYYRDIHDHVIRIIEAVDNMRDMVTAAMQVDLALVTVGQNEIVKKLASWGAILAIPTMVFSLYGMNFKNMPELEWVWAYPASVGFVLCACVFLYRQFKRVEWL